MITGSAYFGRQTLAIVNNLPVRGLSIPVRVYVFEILEDIHGGCISKMLADALIVPGPLGV